ncbi:MAG: glycosyltransferase [Cyclobacteriaceae bacterium]|nr:glycosyltransferase [Cyclobacteriaceae bacterium]
MKFVFLVQGEGRGHMTQAITLSKILQNAGHQVVHTFIGKSDRRVIPPYFFEQIGSPADTILSPNFVLDKHNKSLNIYKSITFNARLLGKYKQSLDLIHKKVKETRPDVLINFYDFLGGFYFRFYHTHHLKHVCIGRQFLTRHPDFPFEADREMEKKLFLLNNKITSQNCDKYLALSFRPYHPAHVGKLVVVPPLLKEETQKSKSRPGDFLLAYMVNDGYAEDLISWHALHPEMEIHCFWDRKNMPETYQPHEHLTFHQINNELFTDLMRRCKGFVSTAGFESVCEALYLQKPVFMIPVEGQYEQACNALDGEIAGAGIKGNSFDLSRFMAYLPLYQPSAYFRQWVDEAESVFVRELTNF